MSQDETGNSAPAGQSQGKVEKDWCLIPAEWVAGQEIFVQSASGLALG